MKLEEKETTGKPEVFLHITLVFKKDAKTNKENTTARFAKNTKVMGNLNKITNGIKLDVRQLCPTL